MPTAGKKFEQILPSPSSETITIPSFWRPLLTIFSIPPPFLEFLKISKTYFEPITAFYAEK